MRFPANPRRLLDLLKHKLAWVVTLVVAFFGLRTLLRALRERQLDAETQRSLSFELESMRRSDAVRQEMAEDYEKNQELVKELDKQIQKSKKRIVELYEDTHGMGPDDIHSRFTKLGY